MPKLFSSLVDKFSLEKSKNIYHLPLKPDTPVKNILFNWPSHEGKFRGAVDFAVELGTAVCAPSDGVVIEVVDLFDKYGPSEEFAGFLNYITISHTNGEFSQLAHLKKGSVKIRPGQSVKTGQVLGVTGLNGWMEEPFLEHLHFFVFRYTDNGDFKGLKIRFAVKPKVSV